VSTETKPSVVYVQSNPVLLAGVSVQKERKAEVNIKLPQHRKERKCYAEYYNHNGTFEVTRARDSLCVVQRGIGTTMHRQMIARLIGHVAAETIRRVRGLCRITAATATATGRAFSTLVFRTLALDT
jgi:hypothetical protein